MFNFRFIRFGGIIIIRETDGKHSTRKMMDFCQKFDEKLINKHFCLVFFLTDFHGLNFGNLRNIKFATALTNKS